MTGCKEVVIARGKDDTSSSSCGHTGHILALAISSDGIYLVREREEGESM